MSYPTIRARLDRLIARLRAVVEGRAHDPLTEVLASLVERGELSVANARRIRETAEQRPGNPGGAQGDAR